MCIRDRFYGVQTPQSSPKTIWIMSFFNKIFGGSEDEKSETTFWNYIESVSYTHLDVYKRKIQGLPHPNTCISRNNPKQVQQFQPCLLYTSRCV